MTRSQITGANRHLVALLSLFTASVCACDAARDDSAHSSESRARQASEAACSPSAPDLAEAFQRIDSVIARGVEAEEIPGLAAGIVCADTLIWAAGYGVLALDDPTPVTSQTLFRIASVTKLFTATGIMALEESGALALDDPVRDHLRWFEIGRPPGTGGAPVTIRQLLTHSAGMPRDSRLTDFSHMYQPNRHEAIAALPNQQLQATPGESYAYSNLGYAILGEVIAAAAGTTYAGYLERAVLEPLGMTRTLVHPTPDDTVAWGHGPRRPDGPRARAGFWELRFATPAGGMASSVAELSEFMILQLAPYVGAQPAILSPEAIREMHRVHFMVDSTRGGSGLGWAVEISNGQHVIYHGGELPEQTAFLLLDLKGAIGVVVLSNAQDVDANGLAQEALRIVRGVVLGPGSSLPAQAIPP